MKKMNIIRLICLSCFMYMASSAASAQDLKSILSGVANAVANKVQTHPEFLWREPGNIPVRIVSLKAIISWHRPVESLRRKK